MARTKITVKLPDFSKWENAVEDLTNKTGLRIEEVAKETAPVDTGNYRSEINFDGANTVIASADYSADIEYGTQAHIIEPNTQKFLKFRDKNGEIVFRKIVHHPGTRPNPVMRNAAKTVQKEITQLWIQAQKDNGL